MRKSIGRLLPILPVIFSPVAWAWSPFDPGERPATGSRWCWSTIADTCPEGATCNENGEVICRPGEACATDEEPDCE